MNTIIYSLPYLVYAGAIVITGILVQEVACNLKYNYKQRKLEKAYSELNNASRSKNIGELFVKLMKSNLFVSQYESTYGNGLNNEKIIDNFKEHLSEDVKALMQIDVF